MKKSLLVSAAALALAAAATVAPVAVSAAPAKGQTTAEFTVKPGDDTTPGPGGDEGTDTSENLYLVKAPDLNFDKTTVAKIISGTQLTYKDSKTKVQLGDLAESQDGDLQVSDLRGTGDGWKLSVAVSPFTNSEDTTDTNALNGTLNLVLAAPTTDNAALGTTATVPTGTDSVALWTATAGKGQGTNSSKVTTDTTLDINANASVKAAQYDATVTWTLGSTADTAQ